MPVCLECGKYAKYHNGLCTVCFVKKKQREKQTKNIENTGFPAHTELYRDLSIIEDFLVEYLIDWYGENYENDSNCIEYKFSLRIEEHSWDIALGVHVFYEKKNILGFYKKNTEPKQLYFFIEYKSSINEWGKQIDQFFRQIKSKIEQQRLREEGSFFILMSFDDRFLDYADACKRAGIDLVVLPNELLYILQGKDKAEKVARKEELLKSLHE